VQHAQQLPPCQNIIAGPDTCANILLGVDIPADLIRLVTDPTVSRIQLVGDIMLSHDLFPPEESVVQAKGVTVATQVSCRANNSMDVAAGAAYLDVTGAAAT
jgi:hypothetical protein